MTKERSGRRDFAVHVSMPNGTRGGIEVSAKSHWTGAGLVISRALSANGRDEWKTANACTLKLIQDASVGA